MKPRSVHLLLACLVVAVVGCDHATKRVAEHELRAAGPIHVISGAVDLRYAQNHGVAFNGERLIPKAARTPVVFVGGFLALALIVTTWLRRRHRPSLEHVAYAVLVGGALGNLIDRVLRGYVVDFIHVHGWPIFNVADIAIVVGAGLWILHAMRSRRTRAA